MIRTRVATLGAAALMALAVASPASAVTQTFNGPAAGTVVAGLQPGGGTAPGTLFPDFTLSVTNNGGGPNSLIIFDSANPTGGDPDLGTPNQTFGGPGIGAGGEMGQPGENGVALGNLLIVAEDIIDVGGDGFVDDPDDEAGGGVVRFDFTSPTNVLWVKIIDIDDGEGAQIRLYNGANLLGSVNAVDYGNNSAQTLDFSQYGPATAMEIDLWKSGAIGEIEYRVPTTSTESSSWGDIKNRFR